MGRFSHAQGSLADCETFASTILISTQDRHSPPPENYQSPELTPRLLDETNPLPTTLKPCTVYSIPLTAQEPANIILRTLRLS